MRQMHHYGNFEPPGIGDTFGTKVATVPVTDPICGNTLTQFKQGTVFFTEITTYQF